MEQTGYDEMAFCVRANFFWEEIPIKIEVGTPDKNVPCREDKSNENITRTDNQRAKNQGEGIFHSIHSYSKGRCGRKKRSDETTDNLPFILAD